MNLEEFTSELPKPWLDINADTFNADEYKINGTLITGTYDANPTAVAGVDSILALNSMYFRVGNYVYVFGNVRANILNGATEVLIDFNLVPGTANINTFSMFSHMDGMGVIQLVNRDSQPGVGFVTLRTLTADFAPTTALANVWFNYYFVYVSS